MAAGKQKEGSKSSHSQGKTSVDMKKPDDWMYKYQNDGAESSMYALPLLSKENHLPLPVIGKGEVFFFMMFAADPWKQKLSFDEIMRIAGFLRRKPNSKDRI